MEGAVRKFLPGGVTQRQRHHREAIFLTKRGLETSVGEFAVQL